MTGVCKLSRLSRSAPVLESLTANKSSAECLAGALERGQLLWSRCGQLSCISSWQSLPRTSSIACTLPMRERSDVWQNRWIRFAEAVAGLERGGSSSAGASQYSLRSNPPIIKIVDRESSMRKVRQSCPVTSCTSPVTRRSIRILSEKAERAATAGEGYSSTYGDPDKPARFFSYQVG